MKSIVGIALWVLLVSMVTGGHASQSPCRCMPSKMSGSVSPGHFSYGYESSHSAEGHYFVNFDRNLIEFFPSSGYPGMIVYDLEARRKYTFSYHGPFCVYEPMTDDGPFQQCVPEEAGEFNNSRGVVKFFYTKEESRFMLTSDKRTCVPKSIDIRRSDKPVDTLNFGFYEVTVDPVHDHDYSRCTRSLLDA